MRVDGRTKKVLLYSWLNGSWNKRGMDDNILSSGDTTTDSIFKPYLKTQEKNNTKKDDERSQTKRECNDADLEANSASNTLENEKANKRMCNAERTSLKEKKLTMLVENLRSGLKLHNLS
nr:hypothetical protein [Tanacetum cinerariifolium]